MKVEVMMMTMNLIMIKIHKMMMMKFHDAKLGDGLLLSQQQTSQLKSNIETVVSSVESTTETTRNKDSTIKTQNDIINNSGSRINSYSNNNNKIIIDDVTTMILKHDDDHKNSNGIYYHHDDDNNDNDNDVCRSSSSKSSNYTSQIHIISQ